MTRVNSLCAFEALRSAGRAATQLYDLVLQPVGLKASEFTMLRIIAEAGEIPQWKLSRDHAIALETLSRRLAKLRKKGLLDCRKGSNHDERIYSLTPRGQESLKGALPYWQRAQARLRKTLGNAEFDMLLRICQSTVRAARDAEHLRAMNSTVINFDTESPELAWSSDDVPSHQGVNNITLGR
jgi:DNA-binding MarR family transcriptional regulator